MVKSKKKVLLITFVSFIFLLTVYGLYITQYNNSSTSMLVNKHRLVIVENNEIVDYKTIDSHAFKSAIVDEEKFDQLKQYMQENNLEIKPGEYEIEDADSFKKLLKKINFKKSGDK